MENDNQNQYLPPLSNAEPPHRWRALKAAGACAMAGLLGVGAYHYYPKLQEQDRWVTEMPAVKDSLSAFEGRMKAAEERLRTQDDDRSDWGKRLDTLEGKVHRSLQSSLQTARHETERLTAQLRIEMERRGQVLQARLASLESDREADRARVARLEQDVNATHAEISQQSQQIAQLRERTNHDLDHLDQQVAGLHGDLSSQQRNVELLDARTGRQRIDFEVSKNHGRDVAPGVLLAVNRTNTDYRRVDGWLWLMPDRRTVWIRGQNVQQPVIFYTREDPRPRELVFTHVTKDAVVGYVLIPSKPLSAGSLAQAGSGPGAPPAQ